MRREIGSTHATSTTIVGCESRTLAGRRDCHFRLDSDDFYQNRYDDYCWMREQTPVCQVRISIAKGYAVSRYDDCINILKDHRVVRSRRGAG